MQKLIMTIDEIIKDEKLQYDIITEASRISALSEFNNISRPRIKKMRITEIPKKVNMLLMKI